MKTHLALALAGAALIALPAAAQTTATPDTTTKAQADKAPAMYEMKPGQWRATKLTGVNVYNNNNEKIGDVNELIVGRDGKVEAVVIGVGGFLGMGEHNVAMKWDQVKFVDQPVQSTTTTSNTGARPNTTGSSTTTTTTTRSTVRDYPDHAMLNMTKDQLKALPEFKYASDTSKSETRTDTTKK